ncbi:MAG TPA: endonuclease/exonuclease/phosphatase family protein [Pseudomonas sp.]|nr:endonuclease/exonuclease/phosphatase family protein [Pseudomonas sp.]
MPSAARPWLGRLRAWLLAGALLSLLAPLGSALGRLDWRLELFSHFLPHACIALLLAGLVLRPPWLRLGFLAAGLGGLVPIALTLALPFGPSQRLPALPAPGTLRAMSFNLNLDNRDMPAVARQIEQAGPDLLLLIEVTPAQWQALAALRRTYPHGCGQPRNDPFGMALLSRLPLRDCVVEGELPTIVARLAERPLTLVGLHPPPPLNTELAGIHQQQLRHWGTRLANRAEVVLLGDLNLTPWSPWYRDLLATTGLQDARAGRGYYATWPAPLGAVGLPLDQALLGADWRALGLETRPAAGSDHRALVLDLAPRTP